MKDVFISFSSREQNEATRICEYLESHSLTCFISSRDLIPGEEYASQLVNNISDAKCVVLMLSSNSNQSPHVLREVEYAVSHRIPILVYPLETVTLSKSMEYFLMTHQWIIDTPDKDEKLYEAAMNIIHPKDSKSTITKEAERSQTSNELPTISKNIKFIVSILLVIVVILVIIGILLGRSAKQKKPIEESTNTTETQNKMVDWKLGDTITFGNYYDEPIEWRVIHINDDGTAVLLSEQILTFKVFDAPESGEFNYYEGQSYWGSYGEGITDPFLLMQLHGSNDWAFSNLRGWLYSDKETVIYNDQAPTKKAAGKNFYSTEPGFSYGFSPEEKEAIVLTPHYAMPNHSAIDASERASLTVYDTFYLLSSDELIWLKEAGMNIYATPTNAAIEHNKEPDGYPSHVETYGIETYYWWLRDTPKENADLVNIVTCELEEGNGLDFIPWYAGVEHGVRPAVTVDMSSPIFK